MTEKQKMAFVSVEIEHYLDLKRKEQEYERLKRDYFKQNEWLQERAKECEEYKTQLKQVKYLYEVQDEKLIDELATENKKYKQALDEIYKICHRQSDTLYPRVNPLKEISGIIDKAKEQ